MLHPWLESTWLVHLFGRVGVEVILHLACGGAHIDDTLLRVFKSYVGSIGATIGDLKVGVGSLVEGIHLAIFAQKHGVAGAIDFFL